MVNINISFFNTSSERNKINKTLSGGVLYSGTLRDSTSIINPVFDIAAESLNYNYCYIEQFNRYYFVDDITSIRNGLWRVTLSIDVLYTYRENILVLPVIIDKQQYLSEADVYLDDGSWVTENKTWNQAYTFSSGFPEGQYILLTAGAI